MNERKDRWALVLAAGSGTRLESLTRIGGARTVPKQFWSLSGGATLLEETLDRAYSVAGRAQVVVVVAEEHEPFWREALRGIPDDNIVVQPCNRGTGIGILLGVSAVHAKDPDARIVVLPSDHFVARERVLRRSIRRAMDSLDADTGVIRFLGIEPESADSELGYIVCGSRGSRGAYRVAQFVEKPTADQARELLEREALWNSFILAGTARAFLELAAERHPHITAAFIRAACNPVDRAADIAALYADLTSIDFSRDVVQGAAAALEVLRVPACGWTDLGTPRRVAECLERTRRKTGRSDPDVPSLAEAHQRVGRFLSTAEQRA